MDYAIKSQSDILLAWIWKLISKLVMSLAIAKANSNNLEEGIRASNSNKELLPKANSNQIAHKFNSKIEIVVRIK